jgi:hypothetical protein
MKILLVSEGKHEIGADAESSALAGLVCRIIGDNHEFTLEPVSNRKFKIHKPRGKSADYEKRALACVRYAEREGFEALILVVDEDGDIDREAGITNSQNYEGFRLPRALGLAIHSFDAWMLADHVAMSKVVDRTINLQKQPETIKDPKSQCTKILAEAECAQALSEVYRQIVAIVDLVRLTERCPKGYAPFQSRVRALSQQ